MRVAIAGRCRTGTLLRRAASAMGIAVVEDDTADLVMVAEQPWAVPDQARGAREVPGERSRSLAQDRLDWLWFLHNLYVPTPAFSPAGSTCELEASLARIEPPAVVRARRSGAAEPSWVTGPKDASELWEAMGCQELVVEAVEPDSRRLVLLASRSLSGSSTTWALAERLEPACGGVMYAASAAGLPAEAQGVAARYAGRVLEAAEHVGAAVLTMELGPRGLLVNGFAPGPSPEADWTLAGGMDDQYATHLRAALDLPCGVMLQEDTRAVLIGGGAITDVHGVTAAPDPAPDVCATPAMQILHAPSMADLILAVGGV